MPVLVLVLVLEQVPVLALVLEQVPVLVPVLVLPAHLVLDVGRPVLPYVLDCSGRVVNQRKRKPLLVPPGKLSENEAISLLAIYWQASA